MARGLHANNLFRKKVEEGKMEGLHRKKVVRRTFSEPGSPKPPPALPRFGENFLRAALQ
jgi:hypothetical protein